MVAFGGDSRDRSRVRNRHHFSVVDHVIRAIHVSELPQSSYYIVLNKRRVWVHRVSDEQIINHHHASGLVHTIWMYLCGCCVMFIWCDIGWQYSNIQIHSLQHETIFCAWYICNLSSVAARTKSIVAVESKIGHDGNRIYGEGRYKT